MSNKPIREQDLEDNPTPRVPVCLCLDVSGSMDAVEGDCVSTGKTIFRDGRTWDLVEGGTTRIDELQKGIQAFYDAVRSDEVAVYSVEICIVTFGDKANCLTDFGSIDRQTIPKLTTENNTAMGEGINLALDLLAKRKQEYQASGVDYYQPWLVLMTDGVPNGDLTAQENARKQVAEMVEQKKLTVFPIAIGNEADISALKQFSPNRTPLRLQGLKFQEFFTWLSQSVARVSQSIPGETVKLELDGIKGWAEL